MGHRGEHRSLTSTPNLSIEGWRVGPPSPRLPLNEVHVWGTTVASKLDVLSRLAITLSGEERARAGRFRDQRARVTFLVGRAALRSILAGYLGRDPARVPLARARGGKPFLSGHAAPQFNLAHSGDLVLCAVSGVGEVGIDVEHVRRSLDVELLTRDVLSEQEQHQVASVPAADRARVFLRYWTGKEAILKASGAGLSLPLDALEPLGSTDRSPISDLPVGPDYVASLATGSTGFALQRWRWEPEPRMHRATLARDDAPTALASEWLGPEPT